MTARKIGIPVLIALLAGLSAALSASLAAPAASPEGAFERLKSLEGEWRALDRQGKLKMRTVYEVVAGGHSLLERLYPGDPDHGAMMSVYHMDGDELIITHYCTAGNQPTMVAKTLGGDRIDFSFLRATNLANISDGHMEALRVTFKDDKHFTQEWIWAEDGRKEPNVLEYTRAR